MELSFQALCPKNWPDLELLFGEKGACGGCWCMYWRLRSADYEKGKGAANKEAFRLHVDQQPAGILAYANGQPIGWCSVAPRENFIRLKHSKILQPVDEAPVWSVVCVFVHPRFRRQRVSQKLIDAAAAYAFAQGATIVEAYPVAAAEKQIPAVFAFTGLASCFTGAGFTEVARRSPTRPVMRRFAG